MAITEVSKEKVAEDIIEILKDLTSDWEYDGEISSDTKLFFDLGFESIDAVALVTAVEGYCRRPLPFAEFLTELGEQGIRNLNVDQLVEFIYQNMNSSKPGEN